MEFDEIVKKRRSVRAFKDKTVPWEALVLAADAAKEGPYAGNVNQLRFVLIEDKETIKKLAKYSQQDWVADAGAMAVVCADDRDLINLYGDRGLMYASLQTGAAVMNFINKIVDYGLGACWIGAFAEDLVKLELGIPDFEKVYSMIAIGYEKGTHHRPRKRELKNAIYWEVWEKKRRPLIYKEPPVH